MASWKIAITGEPVSLISPIVPRDNVAGATFTIPAGTQLSAMTARLGERSIFPEGGSLFCTPAESTFAGLYAGFAQRACLVDGDQDGAFDHAAVATGGSIGAAGSDFVVSEAVPLERPVPFSVAADRPEVVQVGLVVDRTGRGGKIIWGPVVKDPDKAGRLDRAVSTTAVRDKSRPQSVIGEFRTADLPQRIEVAGLSIEVVGADERGMTYRLLSGFDPAQPVRYYYIG